MASILDVVGTYEIAGAIGETFDVDKDFWIIMRLAMNKESEQPEFRMIGMSEWWSFQTTPHFQFRLHGFDEVEMILAV